MLTNIIEKITGAFDYFSPQKDISAAGITDIGLKREKNEDSLYMDEPKGLFIVSDGVGGAEGGAKASDMVVHKLPDNVTPENIASHSMESVIEDAIIKVSNSVKEYAQKKGMVGTGATAVICLIRDNKAVIGHLGDSRAYLLRNNEMKQLTRDHSVVSDLVQKDIITKEEAEKSPFKNQITQCMGMEQEPEPGVKTIDLKEGDKILLCTDGLTGMVSDDSIKNIINGEGDINRACEKLINSANGAGGKDNITALIIKYGE